MKKSILAGFAVLILGAGAVCAQLCTDIPPNLVAWWRAENNALDALGTNHGTLQNGASFAAALVNQGFSFDGLNDYISIPTSPELQFVTDFSISVWAKADTTTGTIRTIVSRYDASCWNGGNNCMAYLLRIDGDAVPRAYFASDSGNVKVCAGTVVDTNWHHYAITYSTASVTLFVDGAAVSTVATAQPISSKLIPTAIGANSVGGETFKGLIDEVAMFNRVLSSSEVASIYAAGSAGKCVKPYFLTATDLAGGIIGAPYSNALAVAITPGPHTFSLVNGSLPPGLSLAANGLISGTPVSDSSSSFTVQAVSSLDQTNSKTFTLRTYTAPPGLVAWWRAENNVLDSLGTNAFTETIGSPQFVVAKVGQGFKFDGSSGYALSDRDVLDFGTSDSFTYETWVRVDGIFASASALLDKRQTGGGLGYVMGVLGSDSGADARRLYVVVQDGGSSRSLMTAPVLDNGFHHLAVAANRANNTLAIYLDGSLQQTADLSGFGSVANNGRLLIGHQSLDVPATSGVRLNGVMDELALYRRALTSTEVAALYNAGSAGRNTDKPYFLTLDPLPDGGVGTPYSLQFAAAVTPGPHTFALVSGTLPPGLELTTNGLLYGTPTVGATNTLTILATSSLGQTNLHTFTLQIFNYLCPAPTNLVAWWRAQDDALDAVGTNHGALNNGVLYASGKVGRCFDFDGVDDYVRVPDSTLWDFGQNDFTIELWMNTRQLKNSVLISQQSGATYGGFSFHYYRSEDKLYFNRNTGAPIIGRSWIPQTNRWYHLAVTRTSGTYRLFVDGQQLGIEQFDSNPVENVTGDLRISGLAGLAGYEVAGRLDEIAIYQRSLPIAELSAIHAAGTGGKCGAVYLTTLSPLSNAGQGAAYSQPLAVTGGDSPYSFALLNGALPDGLSLSTNGVVSGTPSGFGVSDFTVRVTDAQTRPAERHYFLQVNARPVLPVIASQSVDELATLTVTNTATDADPLDTLTYELINSPANASISASGVITWTPTEEQGPVTTNITTVVTDDGEPNLSATNTFTVVVNELNIAPVLTLPPDTNINELVAFTANATATDADVPANPPTFAKVSGPANLTVSSSGVIDWTPSEDQAPGTNTVFISVTDSSPLAVNATSLSVTNSFQIVVREVNVAPVLTLPPDTNINELVAFMANATATDADFPTNARTFAKVSGPATLTVSPSGVINWTPTENDGPSTNTVFVSVTDTNAIAVNATSFSVTNSFQIVVREVNVAPVLSLPPDTNINELVAFTANATATDSDLPTNALVFAKVSGPATLTVSPGGVINWAPAEDEGPSTNTVIVSVTDTNAIAVNATSFSATNSFQIVVREVNVAPVLTLPPDTNINELVAFTANATATDADFPTNARTFAKVAGPANLTVSPSGVINWTPAEDQVPRTNTVTISVTDTNPIAVNAVSLSVTNSFQIVVNEVNVAPVLGPLNNHTVNAGEVLSFTATATDADVPTNTLAFDLLSPPSGAVIDPASGFFTWRPGVALADTTNTVQVRVQDNGAPVSNDVKSFTVIVNALAPVVLTPVSYSNGQFQFEVSGTTGPDYVIMASTNLTSWTDLATNVSPALPFQFNDPAAGEFSNRAYRVRLEP